MKLRLTIDVEYDPNTIRLAAAKALLDHLPTYAVNRGMLTNNTPAVVTAWSHKVEVVSHQVESVPEEVSDGEAE